MSAQQPHMCIRCKVVRREKFLVRKDFNWVCAARASCKNRAKANRKYVIQELW